MAQTATIISSLKTALKSHGLTYRDVARTLELSEASVKRLFAENNLSLQRLDQICQLMNMEITDLIKQVEAQRSQLTQLTEEQEKELVSDLKMVLVTFLVINGWQYDDMLTYYHIQPTELIQYLAKLDRLKVIDLLPNNRIHLRVSPKFSWRQNGPIQQYFSKNLQEDFLKSRFEDEHETFMFLSGMMSTASSDQFQRRIRQLARDFHSLIEDDRTLPVTDRSGHSMFLAFRPWRPDVFEKMRRKK